ncbi:MAG: phosphoenolpyruvate carboxykinase (ATP) [Candidatus Eisenbacteria bacterium]|nr:phosphoenolpyruvate carboxykinase (ATP) [Candidatus Eisenbacteria bacterium]
MPPLPYDPKLYARFVENLRSIINQPASATPNIRDVTLSELKPLALQTGLLTKNGSYCWRSSVSSRIAARTLFLGGPDVWVPKPTDVHRAIVEAAPDELHKILHLMRTMPFVRLRRRMGDNSEFNPACTLYVSVQDPKNYRIAYAWGNTMAEPDSRKPGPQITMIHIPEEHSLRMQVLSLPEYDLNIALSTDYVGEDKKGFLRQAMYRADLKGMLGLHAGTKMVTVRDAKDGKLKTYGVFMFGLTATGKSTWSCHQLGLDYKKGENTKAVQDDIVFLRSDGSAYGSEQNFYVKTDVDSVEQEAMYNALSDKTALLENVMVEADGTVNFLDERLGENGRGVIKRDRLMVRQGRRMVKIAAKSINLPPLEVLDGIVFAFITRRNTILPAAQQLTPEQAVLAYLWGESTHSFATVPAKAGESARIVGTDDFIVGAQGRKVNRFYEMIMTLVERYPEKVRFFQYNTGGMGEIIETVAEGGQSKKKLVRKATRVPIPLMSAIQRGDLRGTNRYEVGRFGTGEIVSCAEGDLTPYDPARFYGQEDMARYAAELVEGRRKFTEEITAQGLDARVKKLAEDSFRVAEKRAMAHGAAMGKEAAAEHAAAPTVIESKAPPRQPQPGTSPVFGVQTSKWITPWVPKTRPPRSGGVRGS